MLTTTATDPGDALLITRCLTSRPWSHVQEPITLKALAGLVRYLQSIEPPAAVRTSRASFDALPKAGAARIPSYAGIPVIIDNSLPPGTWKLVP